MSHDAKRNARIRRQMAREIAARFRAQARAARKCRCRQRPSKAKRLQAARLDGELRDIARAAGRMLAADPGRAAHASARVRTPPDAAADRPAEGS